MTEINLQAGAAPNAVLSSSCRSDAPLIQGENAQFHFEELQLEDQTGDRVVIRRFGDHYRVGSTAQQSGVFHIFATTPLLFIVQETVGGRSYGYVVLQREDETVKLLDYQQLFPDSPGSAMVNGLDDLAMAARRAALENKGAAVFRLTAIK
ncbi:MAG: hypothetical protein NW215_11975 [Hyphomicrobiales bacterium]|nr:hypothetical protein [Hyphomicrobiales bacterium]